VLARRKFSTEVKSSPVKINTVESPRCRDFPVQITIGELSAFGCTDWRSATTKRQEWPHQQMFYREPATFQASSTLRRAALPSARPAGLPASRQRSRPLWTHFLTSELPPGVDWARSPGREPRLNEQIARLGAAQALTGCIGEAPFFPAYLCALTNPDDEASRYGPERSGPC